MNDTSLQVMLEMKNSASPQLAAFGEQVKATSADVRSTGVGMQQAFVGVGEQSATTMADIRKQNQDALNDMKGLKATLVANQQAFSDMATGVNYLGTTFLGLGVAMQMSNNEMLQSMGNTAMMVGAIMTAVGSASQFVYAISKMIQALKALRVQQILTQAFAGPAGWISLGVGAAVAGGALYGVSRMEGGAAKTGGTTVNNNVTQNIQGSVVTERQLTDSVQRGLLEKGQRSGTTGIK